jgi:hypothetical protein
MKDTDFYTSTMAGVYAQQGHFERAAEIYRFLLEREPNRKDIADALAEIEKQLEKGGAKTDLDLFPMFRKWVLLLLEYSRIQKLKRCKHDLTTE